MNATQTVVYTQLLAFILFALGGPDGTQRVKNGVRRLQGKKPSAAPAKSDPKLGIGTATGWAIMFLFLIVGADLPATSDIAIGFAWLILLVVALLYGTDAFRNITSIGQSATK